MQIAFKGATMIDGTGGVALDNATVIVDGSKITYAGNSPKIDDDVRVVDITGQTIMPGIIDTHVHFCNFYVGFLPFHPKMRYGYIWAKTVWSMERMLSSGVTSAQDLGGLESGYVDVEEEGSIAAPRLRGNAVQFMMPTNGSTDHLPGVGGFTSARGDTSPFPGIPDPHCDGPWGCRKKIREVLLAGADVIKIGSGGCMAMRRYDHFRPTFTREEIDVFVDEGKRQDVKVVCHVVGGPGIEDAISAGVHSIEHGQGLDDRLLDQMAERGTWWVPTFWVIKFHSEIDETQEARDQMKRYFEMTTNNIAKAHKAGVRIAMGSDGGLHDPENNGAFLEMEYMSDGGMPNAAVIHSSTGLAAQKIGSDDITGTLEAGKEADLLILDGDPLEEIRHLKDSQRKKLVLKAGKPVGGTWMQRDLATMSLGNG